MSNTGIKVTQLPQTDTGNLDDFLIKDDAPGTPGSTKKITIADFIAAYNLSNLLEPIEVTEYSISLDETYFTGNQVLICSNVDGVEVQLPDARTVTIGARLRISNLSSPNGTLTLLTTDGQTIDGQSISIDGVIVQRPDYQIGQFVPAQQFCLYSDGENWQSANNF